MFCDFSSTEHFAHDTKGNSIKEIGFDELTFKGVNIIIR